MTGVTALRCFIALEIPDDIRRYLASLTASLKRPGDGVKWVAPENVHLSLKFLGAVIPEQAEAVKTRLRGLQGRYPPVSAALDTLGAFPNDGQPQVIWAGLALRDGVVQRMRKDIEQQMTGLGFAAETRAFAPHLTLGRVRSARGAGELAQAIARMPVDPRTYFLTSLALVKSDLTPRGAVYQNLLTIALG